MPPMSVTRPTLVGAAIAKDATAMAQNVRTRCFFMKVLLG